MRSLVSGWDDPVTQAASSLWSGLSDPVRQADSSLSLRVEGPCETGREQPETRV